MSKLTCIATNATSIQDAVSKGSRNAVGDMMPVLFATRMVMPVSRYGTEKAMTRSRPEFILSEVITMSASPLISSETRPFHCQQIFVLKNVGKRNDFSKFFLTG